jgi:hypothetical protein
MAVETKKSSSHHSGHSLSALSLAALGVVYRDIGTSPLYTFRVVLDAAGKHPASEAVLGSLSLIVWTLIIITTVKYIILALRMDNEGEGGVLALMALLSRKPGRRLVLLVGMFGAALVYGDCALTPAISVLSALEGLHVIAPELDRFVLPGTVAVLAALFAVQQRGTALLGRYLGPVMATWFAVLALLGLWGIAEYPAVLWAIRHLVWTSCFPVEATSWRCLAACFLCVTGAEALYADLGHFGRAPIRLGWCVRGFPGAGPELCGAGGDGAGRRAVRRKSLLPPLPRADVAASAGHTRHDCNRRREPSCHHGCLLDDTPGDPVGLPPAAAYRPDVGRRIWPDLRARRELAADGCNARACHRLSNLREPVRRLWNSGVGGHGADNLPSFDCSPRDLGFAAAGSDRNWRRVCHGGGSLPGR